MAVVLTLSSASGDPGQQVILNLSVTGSPVALEWDFSYPSGVTLDSVALGIVSINAAKSLARSGDECIIWSLPNNTIGDGVAATATFTISQSASGSISIGMADIVASDDMGVEISSSGVNGAVTVTSGPVVVTPGQSSSAGATPAFSVLINAGPKYGVTVGAV